MTTIVNIKAGPRGANEVLVTVAGGGSDKRYLLRDGDELKYALSGGMTLSIDEIEPPIRPQQRDNAVHSR